MTRFDGDVVIVGAGFAGMYALHRVRQMSLRAHVIEAASDVGGTWWWNRYPGARCDIESLDYSYSFDPELEQEWEWTERYATQPEILRYANHVADRYWLRADIDFDTRVVGASFDEEHHRWLVRTDGGDEHTARFLILALGCLSTPKRPEIAGIDTFAGPTYHTSSWPHEGVDFTGQQVGIIGTGSSGIQSIPLIAEQAERLVVFQRTPNFSTPAKNALLDPAVVAAMKADYRAHRQALRASRSGVVVALTEESAAVADSVEREERFTAGWEKGSLFGVSTTYADLLIDPASNELAAEYLRTRIRGLVHDPDVAETLSPRGYPYATKRPCLDTGYFETFNRDNVDLVDLRATPIVEVVPTGIRTTETHVELDAIVFATGFDAMTGPLLALDIIGRDARTLREHWAAGARTYLGLTMAGFPNLFTITGPGSPSVLSNMMVSIEQHVEWVSDCIVALDGQGATCIEASAEAEEGWVEHVDAVGNMTLYPLADSWYMGANVPGKPRVFLPYVGGCGLYREICDGVAAGGYQGFQIT